MFFGRFGHESSSQVESGSPAEAAPRNVSRNSGGKRHRRLAALSLAVAVAAPVGVAEIAKVYAQEAPAGQAVSSGDLLRQGQDQLKKGQYEEALGTLQQIKAEDLSSKDQKALDAALASAQSGADQRKNARAEYELGDASLNDGKTGDAIRHYRAAASSKYADSGTKQKALEKIALAEAQQKNEAGQRATLYKDAVADYKAGNLESARGKFEELRAAGFKAPLFQKSPNDYLKSIDQRMGAEAPVAKTEPKSTEAAPAPAPAPAPEAAAPAPAPAPAVVETPAPAPAPAAAETQTAATDQPAPANTRAEAKQAYKQGHDQYRKGDWIAARQNLERARDLGYKPGLFEEAPSSLLAKMDRKEQADAAKAARAAEATAAAPAATEAPQSTTVTQTTTEAPAPAPAPQTTAAVQPAPAPTEPAPATPPAAPATPQAALEDTARLQRIRTEAQAAEAQQLVDQARTAQQENRLTDALSLYSRAADLDPTNQAAVAGRAQLQTLTGRTTAGTDIARRFEQDTNIRRQAIRDAFNSAIQRANDAIAAHDWRAAEASLASARVARDQDPAIFTRDEVRDLDRTLEQTQLTLNRTRETVAGAEAQQRGDEARQREQQRIQEEEQSKRNTVASLIQEARRAVEEAKYREAISILDQILSLDPSNDYALGVRPLVDDKIILLEQRRFREEFQRQMVRQFNQAEEKKIPYDDIFRYPDNWPDISAARDAEVAESRGVDAEDRETEALLDRRLPEVKFDAVPFSDAIDFFRDVSGANVYVNWGALEAVAIDKTTPVTVRLRNVTFRKALTTVLTSVGGANARLGYKIDQGVVTISTADDLKGEVTRLVYDIRDLLVQQEDFDQVPFIDIAQQQTVSRGGGGGQNPIQSGGRPDPTKQRDDRLKRIQEIEDFIRASVGPDTWSDTGGVGALNVFNGQLIVAQTPENHREIAKLLSLMRETQGVQVNIEARFLFVQRNYLEDIGLDLGVIFNQENPARTQTINGQVIRVPGSGRFSPITVGTGSTDNSAFLSGVVTGAPGTLATASPRPQGLSASGSFLDDFQVNLLLRATQANINSTLVTAPRVTVFNGQEAYIAVVTQQAYIGDLEAVVATGAALFRPVPAIAPSGTVLYVRPTVSSDRKYVTMSLRPQIGSLLNLTPFTFQTGTSQAVSSGVGGVITAAVPSGTIQLPTFQVTDIRTIVSVPDGGTLLLGGQTIAGESERESGTPVLSKIPFLKRLFTNKSMAKDEQVLLILVKPTILIQREQEGRQFPLLSQKVGS